MIRKAESKSRNARALQDSTKLNLPFPFTVPLRKHDDGEILVSSKESPPHRVVLRVGGLDGAGKFQDVVFELITCRGFVGIKTGAVLHGPRNIFPQYRLRIPIAMAAEVIGSPVERQRFAIIVAPVKSALTPLDKAAKQVSYNALTSASAGCRARRPVACSTCCRHEIPGATTTALGLFSTAGKSRRLPIAMDMS